MLGARVESLVREHSTCHMAWPKRKKKAPVENQKRELINKQTNEKVG